MKARHMVASLQNAEPDFYPGRDEPGEPRRCRGFVAHETLCWRAYCYDASKSSTRRLRRMFEGGSEKVHHRDDEALQTKTKRKKKKKKNSCRGTLALPRREQSELHAEGGTAANG